MTSPEVKVEEPKVEEPKTEEKKVEETKPEEKSSLEQKRDELLKTGEEKPEEKKPEEEFVEEDVDIDAIREKHPVVDKLKLKHSSVNELLDDVLTRYAGGHEQFQQNAEFIKDLEKEGIVSSAQRDELLVKLKAKEDITPPSKPEPEKTFKDTRSERLAQLVPKQVRDPDTENPDTGAVILGGVRAITEEEKVAEQKRLESFAEAVSPSDLPDTVDNLQDRILNVHDKLVFTLFRLQPILEEFKDKILPETIYKELIGFSEKFPRTCAEIIETAEKKGENFYVPLYHHFITTTKREQIEVEQKKRWEEERTKEGEKKKAAKVETAKRAGESLEPQKSFAEKSVMAKRQAIVDAKG